MALEQFNNRAAEAAPERAPDSSLPPERAEEMTLAQLEERIAGGRRLGIDERNWHAADHLANLAASGMVRTTDGAIVEYRLGKDGTSALRTWVRDAYMMTPDEHATQIEIEAAVLAAKGRGEAGAGVLEWAATLEAPEATTVKERVSGLVTSFSRRLNINDKPRETDAEMPDRTLAA